MWDLTGPPDAEPMVLGRGPVTTIGAVFEPTGRWLAAEDLNGVTFWPATGRWPSVLRVSAGGSRDVAFDPNGKWIAASAGEVALRFGLRLSTASRADISLRTCPNWPFRRTASFSRRVQGLEACWSCRSQGQASESCGASKGGWTRWPSMPREGESLLMGPWMADDATSFAFLTCRRAT